MIKTKIFYIFKLQKNINKYKCCNEKHFPIILNIPLHKKKKNGLYVNSVKLEIKN